jgi:hypothetical protein
VWARANHAQPARHRPPVASPEHDLDGLWHVSRCTFSKPHGHVFQQLLLTCEGARRMWCAGLRWARPVPGHVAGARI